MRFTSCGSKVPRSWKQVTVSKFVRLLEVQSDSEIGLVLEYLGVLVSPEFAQDYPLRKLGRLIRRLSFISQLPHTGPFKGFFFRGRKYVSPGLESLTVAEYVDLELALIQYPGTKSIPYLLGILFRPIWQRKYSGPKALARGEKFAQLPAETAYGRFVAFMKWREELLNHRFKVLFSGGDGEEQVDEEPINKGGRRYRRLQEELALRRQRWNWYGLVHRLAGGDIRAMETIERMPIVQAFVHLAYEAEQKTE